MHIVYIIGIDGSGKTTLARGLTDTLRQDKHKCRYIYCQHQPILLFPFRLLVRKSFLRSNNSKKDYKKYSDAKVNISKKNKVFARIYVMIWLIDYWLFTFMRLMPSMFSHQLLIVDRYYLDIVVNISQVMGYKPEEMKNFSHKVEKFFIKPEKIFFIDLPEDIAFTRKEDIDSVEYLRERRSRYQTLADEYSFVFIDGTQSVEHLHNIVLESLYSFSLVRD